MSFPLLTTKLYIPPTRAGAIARPRLTEKLLAGLKRPGGLTLLSGPAGFGKTTLLSELVAQLQQPAAWLSLDEGDNDPSRFWAYLIAACQPVLPGVGESALEALGTPGSSFPDEMIATILINDLAQQVGSVVLVLDDYHAIQNASIHAGLLFLLDHLPHNLHLIVSTRTDPPWPLARYRVRNQLTEIRAQDLRFGFDEAAEFLRCTMHVDLSAQDVAALEERTEGWVAGLQLAALSMQGRSDIAGFVKAFTGSHIYVAEYLIEEVLQRQPAEVQAFLLQTSILERLSAGLCAAVTRRQDAQEILTGLHQANLFLVPQDDEGRWFRYHHLFADLLQARLQQSPGVQTAAELHQRAADWFEQEGMTPEAVEHALAAADYPRALGLIGKVSLTLILQAHIRTVEAWLQAIPPAYINQSPQANMAFTWLHLLRGTFAQAAPYIERLSVMVSSPDAARIEPALKAEWLAIQSKLLNVQGKPAESRDLAIQALEILPKANSPVRSMILANLASSYEQMLDYDNAIETFERLIQEARSAGDYSIEILGTAGQGQMLLQQGRLQRAFKTASEGIQRIESTGKSTPFSSTLYGELGQIYYHWHQLERSRKYFRLSMEKSGASGYSDPEIYQRLMLSRMAQVAGDWDGAEQEMRKASELAQRNPPAMIREEVIAQQVCIDLARGRLAAAQESLRPEGFTFGAQFHFPELAPGSRVPHPLGLLYNSALRILLVEAREKGDRTNLKFGLELAARVLAGEIQCQHVPIAVTTTLLRAQLFAELEEETSALTEVAAALHLAEPEGLISVFIEEGEPIATLLWSLIHSDYPGKGKPETIQTILAAFPTPQTDAGTVLGMQEALVEPLTRRELEVLQWIARGDSNQVIAEKLVITVSAVKKHTGNIYSKLNVNSRTQALARARQLGLLAADD